MSKMDKMVPVIVCCGENGRAVVFGYADEIPTPGAPVTLRDARMVLYWAAECGGLFGVAANGPKGGTRITAAVAETRMESCKQVLACSQVAAEGISKWPAA